MKNIRYERYLQLKKRALLLGMMLTLAVTSVGCGKKEADANITEPIYEESSEEAVVGDVVDNEEEEDLPDGKVRNELTGELIDESLANQRPIAVMVDNESIALPHYGLTQADVVYEMMNSTERLGDIRAVWKYSQRKGNKLHSGSRMECCIMS